MNRPHIAWRVFAVLIFPVLTAIFAVIYLNDSFRYIYLLREDGPVEWLTTAFLMLAGLISLDIGIQYYRRERTVQWFFFAFGLFCLVMGFEEISWGQRLFAITPPDYFLGNSDQQEINVHNVLQQKLDFKTKDLAALVLSLYGIALPLLALDGRVAALLQRVRLVVPPLYLSVGFLTASLLMIDVPSGFEEEIGECLFGLAFLFFMLHELVTSGVFRQAGDAPNAAQAQRLVRIDRAAILGLTFLTFGLQVWRLDAKGLWLPEAISAAAARAPLVDIARHGWLASSFELPLWPLMLASWQPLAGSSEFGLRFLPALAATAATPLLWATVKTLWPQQVGLRCLAASLLASSPALHFYAQDSSSYALLTAFSILSLYLTVSLLQRPAIFGLIAWMLVGWLFTLLHLFAVTLLAVETTVLALALLGRETRQLNRGWAGLLLLLAPLPALLWLLFAPGVGGAAAAAMAIIDPEDWSYFDRLAQLWKDLIFGNVLWQSFRARLSVMIVPIFLCGAFVLLGAGRASIFDDVRIKPTSLNWLLLGPVAVAAPLAVLALPMLSSAALMILLPLLVMTTAVGALYLWRTIRTVGMAAILLALALAVVGLATYADGGYAKSDYRAMATFLNARQGSGDEVVLMAPSQHFLADYYLTSEGRTLVPPVPPSPHWPQQFEPLVPHEVDGLIQEALRASPALWLVLHDEDSVDPGRFLQPYLTAVAYRDNCIEWRDVELCRYVSPHFLKPAIRQSTGSLYGQALRLEGIDLTTEASSILGTPAILAELDWVAEIQPSADYKVSLRLLNQSGELVAQRDDYPIGPLLPPTIWGAGDEKPGYIALPLPEALPAGPYTLQVVVYDPSNMTITPYETPDREMGDEPLAVGFLLIDEKGEIKLTQ